MFAHTVQFNVFYQDHFTHLLVKLRRIENHLCINIITLCHELHGLCQALGSFQQPFPFRILTQQR